MLLNWVYENTENASKATQRVKDLTVIANEQNIQGFKSDRIRLLGSRRGYNVNITVDDARFNTYDEAQRFLRSECISMRKLRREEEQEKKDKQTKV